MSALSPSDQFSHYDDEELMKLAKFNPKDFSDEDLNHLEHSFCLYLDNVFNDTRFDSLDTINDLDKLMVTTRKHISFKVSANASPCHDNRREKLLSYEVCEECSA
jgi:hypothetical protein